MSDFEYKVRCLLPDRKTYVWLQLNDAHHQKIQGRIVSIEPTPEEYRTNLEVSKRAYIFEMESREPSFSKSSQAAIDEYHSLYKQMTEKNKLLTSQKIEKFKLGRMLYNYYLEISPNKAMYREKMRVERALDLKSNGSHLNRLLKSLESEEDSDLLKAI